MLSNKGNCKEGTETHNMGENNGIMSVTLVTKYNPLWPVWFEEMRTMLDADLGDSHLSIEHVGSTSIPGMTAKPIIDIDIVIDIRKFDEVREKLEKQGYVYEGDLGIVGREAFKLREVTLETELPAHHLYVCHLKSFELRKHLVFRNFLREHPEYLEQLSQLKWTLAEKYDNDRQAYIEGKSDLVQIITSLALQTFDDQRREGRQQ